MTNQYTIIPADFATFSTQDIYGGQSVNMYVNPDVIEDLKWLKAFRARTELEEKLRQENPALKSTWDSYQTMLAIVMDTV
jgi:hypothetical protein